jgi:putative DNA primase/helicase
VLWHQRGLGSTSVVADATDGYRKESDTLGAFLEDRCELNPMFEEPASMLYAAYASWCTAGGEYQITQTAFGRALTERGITVIPGRALKSRLGIRLVKP